ncbi:MAG: TPM domain-containing protein [Leptospiraceae bacterium]|nr:TPM domain-containing protein [Leptospiraceae bacterium]
MALMLITPFAGQWAQVPVIKHPVNDYANILPQAREQALTKLIIDHQAKTGVQIAILAVSDLNRIPIEDYAMQVAEQWSGGSRERDDGVLFVMALKNRQMRLEVGYGLEGLIPDYKAREILDSVRSDFQARNYGNGMQQVVVSIIKETATLKAGAKIPLATRTLGFGYRIASLYTLVFLAGLCLAGGWILLHDWMNNFKAFAFFVSAAIWIQGPVVLFLYFRGVWFWNPIVYFVGLTAGYSLAQAWLVEQKLPNKNKNRQAHFGLSVAMLPVGISLLLILVCLDFFSPDPQGTTLHETIAFYLLIILALAQFVLGSVEWMTFSEIKAGVYNGPVTFGGGSAGSAAYSSHSSGGTSFASNTSASASSPAPLWPGGGGSFGGGGASSSW